MRGALAARILAVCVIATLGTLTWRRAHDFRDRETLWNDTLAKNPNAFLAHNNLGVILRQRGDTAGAVEHFRRAVEIEPGFVEAHINLGAAAQRAGRLDEAAGHYHDAIRAQPDDAAAYNNLGAIHQSRGQLDAAMESYRRALDRKPDFVDALFNLGVLLHGRGAADEASVLLRRAVRQAPEHADALYRLGLIEHAAGRFDNAGRYYEATLRLRPDFPDVYYNLGTTLEARGDANGAIARFGQAVRLRPDWPAALIATARVLFSHPDPASREPALAVAGDAGLTSELLPGEIPRRSNYCAGSRMPLRVYDLTVDHDARVPRDLLLALRAHAADSQQERADRTELHASSLVRDSIKAGYRTAPTRNAEGQRA